jgi:mannosyltransferase OCH1-like enzyme
MMSLSIPKKIYYAWYGPMPALVSDRIAGWKKVMPDYEVIDAAEIFDIHKESECCRWFGVALERELWAFVNDYMRVKILLDHGGIYLDTDITVLKPFDRFLRHNFFAGFESKNAVAACIIGCLPKQPLLRDMYNFYQKDIWETSLFTQPSILTRLLTKKYGCLLFDSRKFPEPVKFGPITLYPEKYFCPYRYDEQYDAGCITDDTHTIHWWSGSWCKPEIYEWLLSKHLPGAADRPDKSGRRRDTVRRGSA